MSIYSLDPVLSSLFRRATRRQDTARAPGTIANHYSAVRTYIAFMARFRSNPLDPTTQMICAFLEYVAEHIPAPATIRNKLSHVHTYLHLSDHPSTATEHPRVRMALDAFDRDKTYVSRKKLPLPVRDFVRAVEALPQSHTGQAVIYYGALRQSAVAPMSLRTFDRYRHPTRADFKRNSESAMLVIKWAKNLQKVGQQKVVTLPVIAGSPLCLVTAVQDNITAVPTTNPYDPLLMLTDNGKPLPVSLIKRIWNTALVSSGVDTAPYSLHSLRKTAATRPMERAVQRWKSKGTGAGSQTHRINIYTSTWQCHGRPYRIYS